MLATKNVLRCSRSHLKQFKLQRHEIRLISSTVISPLGRDESADVLLEMLEGNSDNNLLSSGLVRSFDVVNGIALCSGLYEAKVGDLVQFKDNTGLGVVLTLEEHSVRVGVLQGNVRTGYEVATKASESSVIDDTQFINSLSDSQINTLGQRDGHTLSIDQFIRKAACHWKTWPNKLSERTSTREMVERFDQRGTIFTGVPAVDALCPLWRGGSMVLSGPQKNSTDLATKIANNFLSATNLDNNHNQRPRRVVYVNMSHNQSSLKQLASELGIVSEQQTTNKKPITLIGAPANDTNTRKDSSKSPDNAMFARTLSPYVAIELGEHAAKHLQEDVLLIIDEVGGLTHDVMNAQDALLKTPNHTTSMNQPIRSKAALSSSVRTISASLLDRACILNGGGSLSILSLLNVHPNYDALTMGSKQSSTATATLDSTFEILKESFNGYSDSHLTLAYDDVVSRIRSRHPSRKVNNVGLSLDWELVHDMNKSPPMFSPSLLKEEGIAQSKTGKRGEDGASGDISSAKETHGKNLSKSGAALSKEKSQEVCLTLLGVCLRRLLKETSLIAFAADTAKELGIQIEDENEVSYDLIECSHRTKQLLSQSSIVTKQLSDLLKKSTQQSSFKDNTVSAAAAAVVTSPESLKQTSTSSSSSPDLSKYHQKIKEKLKKHVVEDDTQSHASWSKSDQDRGLVKYQGSVETAMAVTLCALSMMRPDTAKSLLGLVEKEEEVWMALADKFREQPELLAATELDVLSCFQKLTTQSSFAPALASRLINKALRDGIEK